MMKSKLKIIALVTAAVAAATVLSGCRDAARDKENAANVEISDSMRLSAEDYRTSLLSAFNSWTDENKTIAKALYGSGEYYLDRDSFTGTVERSRSYLNGLKEIYPPKKYDKQHNEILLSLDTEYKWLSTAEDVYTALEDKDQAKFDELTEILQKYGNESKFPLAVVEMANKLKQEITE